ncbi:MAG: zinc ribbon domain-containing protein [Firmicutes bacterium]|nr:zinc ribbon domain-containing protein [Bacillota bacterium]
MYCKNCGQQIDDRAVVCVHCGRLTDNYGRPQQTTVARPIYRSQYRNEFYAPFLGLVFSGLGVVLLPLAVVGFVMSIIQYRRAKNVYGETKYTLAGIIIGAVIIGLYALTVFVSVYKEFWAGLPLLSFLGI